MKIILGTANFSEEYGWSHAKAKNIHKILDTALDLGIDTIETAYDYHCLDTLAERKKDFQFIVKVDTDDQFRIMRNMLGALNTTRMKHHPPFSDHENRSIYSPEEISGFEAMVECPYNIIDQRFVYEFGYSCTKWIARSVFIQGLAFSMPDFHGIPFYHLAWNFVRNNPNIDAIVVGVDSAKQLEDILSIPQYEIDYSKIGTDAWLKKY